MIDKKEMNGVAKLLLVSVFWGIGFPAMKIISESFSTFYQVSIRFFIAAVVLSIIFHSRFKLINTQILKLSFVLSVFLFSTYVLATKGVEHTSASRASFFSCLAVLIIPFVLRIAYKKKIGLQTAISIALCAMGLFIISYTKNMGFFFNLGDILCLLCSCCGALHIVATGQIVKDNDPALIALLQMVFVSFLGLISALLFEPYPTNIHMNSIYALLFVGIFGTGISFYLQASCQQFINPTKVGIILSLEPVNGAIASYLILGDSMGIRSVIGGIFIFSSLVYSEIQGAKEKTVEAEQEVSI